MPSRQLDWIIPGSDRQPILGTTHLPPAAVLPAAAFVICHGFKGYKDYGFLPYLAEQAAAHGLLAIRFNFSHGGMANEISTSGPGSCLFERPDLFQRDTWSRQITDLLAVACAIHQQKLPGVERPALPLIFFGHSRGGVTALLAAARLFAAPRPPLPPPLAVVTAAAPDRAASLTPQDRQCLRRQGYLLTQSSRTKQMLRIGRSWFDEIEANPADFDPLIAIRTVRCPVTILHGERDETVPVAAAHALAAAGQPHASLHVVPGASHTFDAPNPMAICGPAPQATQELAARACRAALQALQP